MYAIRDNIVIEASRVSLRTRFVHSGSNPIGFFFGAIMVKIKVQNGFHAIFSCDYCGNEKRIPYQRYIRDGWQHHFCSRRCSTMFQDSRVQKKKRNPTSRSKVSLQEQIIKTKCRAMFSSAVRRGKIIKENCFVCGNAGEAHHPDYGKPYDVEWLCSKHHRELHVAQRLVYTAGKEKNG